MLLYQLCGLKLCLRKYTQYTQIDPPSTAQDLDQIIDFGIFDFQHNELNSNASTNESEEDSSDETYEPPNRDPVSEDYTTDSSSSESDITEFRNNLNFCLR